MTRLAIFASGGGSNAEAIIQFFKDHDSISVELIVSNRGSAYVLQRAEDHSIPSQLITKRQFSDKNHVLDILRDSSIDYIVLAGFLLLIPKYLIEAFPDRILNIHPALLPKYGGKGMYGHHVHKAVHQNKEKESGMTIHLVDEHYDEGKILFQATTALEASDSPDMIAAKVLKLEHRHYPEQVEKLILSQQKGQ